MGTGDPFAPAYDSPEAPTASDAIGMYKAAKNVQQVASNVRGLYEASMVGAENIAANPQEFSNLAGYDLSPASFAGAEQQIAGMYESLGMTPPTNMAPETMLQQLSSIATQQAAASQEQFYSTLKGLEQTDPAAFKAQLSDLPVADQLKYDFMKYTAGEITKEAYSATALQRLSDAGVSEFQVDAQGNNKQLNLFNNYGGTTSSDIGSIGDYTHAVAGPSAAERLSSNPAVSLFASLVPGVGPFLSAGLGALNMAATGNVTLSNALQVAGGLSKGFTAYKDAGGVATIAEQQAAEQAYEAGFKVFQETGDATLAAAAETAALKATQPGLLSKIADVIKTGVNVASSVIPNLPDSNVFTGQYESGTGGMVHQIPDTSSSSSSSSTNTASGGAAGGADPSASSAPNANTGTTTTSAAASPWVYPNEQILTDASEPVSEHTNPDGSIVLVYNDGSTQWAKPPTDMSQWPTVQQEAPGVTPAPVNNEGAVTAPTDNSTLFGNILDWLRRNPDATDAERRVAMDANGVTVADVAAATGRDVAEVATRYDTAGTTTGTTTGNTTGTATGNGTGVTGQGDGQGVGTAVGATVMPFVFPKTTTTTVTPTTTTTGPGVTPSVTPGTSTGTGTGTGGTGIGITPKPKIEAAPVTERTTQMVFDPAFKFNRDFGMLGNLLSSQYRQ
jgi:hypothetical protein